MSRISALIYLGLSGQDFGPCYTDDFTHEEFSAKWRGPLPCPTEEQLLNAKPNLSTVKADKLAEINRECDAQVSAIKATYPETEVQSWPKQEAEARALQADSAASTPLLSAIAVDRGIAVADLASRVLAKSDAFAVISGAAFGKRQRLEAQIEAATTVEQVNAITWEAP